jgi:hypothetical protein
LKTLWKKVFWIVIILVFAISAGFIGWASFPLGPGPDAQTALQSDEKVSVDILQGWTVFQPIDVKPETGFIFYPGGRVDYHSYAPVLNSLAEQGILVVLVPMPLSMAVFSPNKAEAVLTSFPEIQNWAIGGHSLGGAMAARYVFTHPGEMQGLALWASYPASTDSLANQNLEVLSIYGDHDGQLEKLESSGPLLPQNTIWIKIIGGNHAQFGDYGLQPGDGEAQITPAQQWTQVTDATINLLQKISE